MDYHPELIEFLNLTRSDYFQTHPIKINFNDWYGHIDDSRVSFIEGLPFITPSSAQERFYFDPTKVKWILYIFGEAENGENTLDDQQYWKDEYDDAVDKYKKYEAENLIEDDEIGMYTQTSCDIYSEIFSVKFKVRHIQSEREEEINFTGKLVLNLSKCEYDNGKIKEDFLLSFRVTQGKYTGTPVGSKEIPQRDAEGNFIVSGQLTKAVR